MVSANNVSTLLPPHKLPFQHEQYHLWEFFLSLRGDPPRDLPPRPSHMTKAVRHSPLQLPSLKHGYGTALTYPVSETYPIRIRLGYGRDTYPRRVRVSQVMWAGNLRMETSRPGRYGPAAQSRVFVTYSRVPTSRSRLRLTHGQKGRTASAVPRLPLLLPVALRLASSFASQIDAAAPASPFASQIGPPPRPPTRAPPRAAVLLAASSPSPSRPSTPRSGQPRRRPSSVALGPKPTTCSRRGGPSPPSSCFRRPAPPRSRRRAAFILEPEVPRLPVPVNVLLEPGGERLAVPDSPPRSRRPRSPLSIRAPCLGD